MRQQAVYKEQEARKLQEQGDRLARLVVNQLESTPLWFRRQEINQREAARRRALQEEVAEEAKAREQTWQRQSRRRHNKQVRSLVPTGR